MEAKERLKEKFSAIGYYDDYSTADKTYEFLGIAHLNAITKGLQSVGGRNAETHFSCGSNKTSRTLAKSLSVLAWHIREDRWMEAKKKAFYIPQLSVEIKDLFNVI